MALLKEVDAASTCAGEAGPPPRPRPPWENASRAPTSPTWARPSSDTDDVRDSPALDGGLAMHERGARVRVTDPIALSNAAADKPHLTMVEDLDAAYATPTCGVSGDGVVPDSSPGSKEITRLVRTAPWSTGETYWIDK